MAEKARTLKIHATKGGRLYIKPSDLFADNKLFNTIEKSEGYKKIKQEIKSNAAESSKQNEERSVCSTPGS